MCVMSSNLFEKKSPIKRFANFFLHKNMWHMLFEQKAFLFISAIKDSYLVALFLDFFG